MLLCTSGCTSSKVSKVSFANEYLKFACMLNGYGPAMRIFRKITKVLFSVFRMQGHTSVVYEDDSYLQGDSYESCLKNLNDAIIMLRLLAFIVHPEKTVLTPTQNLIYLSFIINSKDMTLKLTEEKKQKLYDHCTKLFEKSKPTIRFVAQASGNIVASFPAVPLGPLFYRALEASISSHLTHLADKDQRNINHASHLVSICLILRSFTY